MDNSNMSNNRVNEHLGVNKLGKGIRKSPLHQPNFSNTSNNNNNNVLVTGSVNARQQPQPRVYNISKKDFRNVVQQLTGSPAHDPYPRPAPPNNNNQHKPPSMRLQKIRPPPLAPMNRPPPVYYHPTPVPPAMIPVQPHVPCNNFVRQEPNGHLSPTPLTPGNSLWANAADSPVSAYMRYLQRSMVDLSPRQPQWNPQLYTQAHVHGQAQLHSPCGLLPSPRMNGPTLLPSPTSQFLLPSPGFFNMLSPRSPYPLLSPGFGNQYPHPLTPNLPFSPMGGQMGILGPVLHPPPLSPRFVFPQSPGFFTMPSPRWRDQWS